MATSCPARTARTPCSLRARGYAVGHSAPAEGTAGRPGRPHPLGQDGDRDDLGRLHGRRRAAGAAGGYGSARRALTGSRESLREPRLHAGVRGPACRDPRARTATTPNIAPRVGGGRVAVGGPGGGVRLRPPPAG